jgi:hypothetical protein
VESRRKDAESQRASVSVAPGFGQIVTMRDIAERGRRSPAGLAFWAESISNSPGNPPEIAFPNRVVTISDRKGRGATARVNERRQGREFWQAGSSDGNPSRERKSAVHCARLFPAAKKHTRWQAGVQETDIFVSGAASWPAGHRSFRGGSLSSREAPGNSPVQPILHAQSRHPLEIAVVGGQQ